MQRIYYASYSKDRGQGTVRTCREICKEISWQGEIDTKVANTVVLACNAILGTIRVDEQAKKIEDLNKLLEEIGVADKQKLGIM